MLASLLINSILAYGLWYILEPLFARLFLKSSLDDLPGPRNKSWLFGNIPQLFNPNGWAFHREILETYGRAMRIRGAFGERLLFTFDPRALHHVLVKDQAHYEESEAFTSRNAVIFGEGLLSTHGAKHRKQRKMLNPVFSINHMRDMTLELIGQSGMGYSFDTLMDDDDNHPYSRSVKRFILLVGGPVGFFANQFLFPFANKFGFPSIKRFLVKQIRWKRVQDIVEITDIMHQTSLKIIKAKQEAMSSAHSDVAAEMANKKDIISILMRANALASEEDRLSEAEVVGQVSTLVFAGMDTTSSALSRILYLLATHQDVQERLRQEIQEAQNDGELTYDQLVFLPYLDAVCRETLRVYPPINLAPMRTAQKDMILPLSKPIQDSTGQEISEVFVQKGTNIVISVLGANCNPDLWGPNSYEWKPERWLAPLPKSVEEAHMPGIYSHLMTFLGGGRACIGFKFSQLEMKVVLSVLLTSFRFSLSKQEIGWQMSGIAGPIVEGPDGPRPQLPLIMSQIDYYPYLCGSDNVFQAQASGNRKYLLGSPLVFILDLILTSCVRTALRLLEIVQAALRHLGTIAIISVNLLPKALKYTQNLGLGASTGFGNAVACSALEHGDIVVATMRDPGNDTLASQYQECSRKGKLLVLKVDVTDPEEVASAFSVAQDTFGRIDIVFNNAGRTQAIGEVEQIHEEVGRSLFDELDPKWNIKITIVEPGPFNTKVINEHLISLPPHPAYTDPKLGVNISRAWMTPAKLTPMAGNVAKGAALFYRLSILEDPPFRLPLHPRVLDRARHHIKSLQDGIDGPSVQALCLVLTSWLTVKILNNIIAKSPLDILPGPPSGSLLFGNIPKLYHSEGWGFHRKILERYGTTMKIKGALGERLLLTFDPKALHHIFVKDQWAYEPSVALMDRNNVYFGEGLLSTLGEQHRKQRKMLNPVFSINHMREMIPLFYEVTDRLRAVLLKKVTSGSQEVDILHWMTRTALELIGQSGMGYSFDSLEDDNDYHPYSRSVKRFISLTGGPVGFFANQFAFHIAAKFKFPRLKRLIVNLIPYKRWRANATASEEDRLTDAEVIGQVSSLVFAGMDTTSSALSRILQLLATHPDTQERLREEILEAQTNGRLNYDQLVTLPFLDAVCRETLRVFPPVNLAFLRTARSDMLLPLSKPVRCLDGQERAEIFVAKGTNVIVSAFGANCNPELWGTDSYEWRPERWLSPVPDAVVEAHMPGIYSHLMTFMGGSRACIGFKFSQLEMKVVLSVLLSSFKFSLSEKEIGWTMNGIAGPYVKGEDKTRPQLPMVMSLLEKSG
ncbi:hypothetical protein NP233_g7435 [Leucocoprinus birnbaumii]|uniref:Cytochrome P450 n=1 Tax=Leucocoprinus birnbaumii TaxID=56174 RepID=A0AAD5VP96_9AGAR|nr:hypothetical protein NP233_g7435 [Leucocoprinus birnbaumii]